MNKQKQYYKNTLILMIGKFSSQLVSFLLLPLYTYKLTTSSYGYIELIHTYISLLSPLLIIQMDSAVFRYLIENRNNEDMQNKVITTSFMAILSALIPILSIFLILNLFIKIKYAMFIVINTVSLIINTYFMSISRGNGHNLTYSISSVINSFITLAVNFILILILKYDAKSILIATIIASTISSLFIFIKEKIYKHINFRNYDKSVLKSLLKYAIPMIPNALSWWIIGLSDRTIIVMFINTAANGIYSVSCKFSNLLNSVFSIFSMSWQETVTLHIDEEDSKTFISKMMNDIFLLFVFASCIIIGLLPLVYNTVIGSEYIDSYNYIPILILANLFSILVGLIGGIYVAKKKTKEIAYTTIFSAIINIIINILFIKRIGLYAACISTLLAYLAMFIYRYKSVKKIIDIKIYFKTVIIFVVVYSLFAGCYYLKVKYISFAITALLTTIVLIINRDKLKLAIKKILKIR